MRELTADPSASQSHHLRQVQAPDSVASNQSILTNFDRIPAAGLSEMALPQSERGKAHSSTKEKAMAFVVTEPCFDCKYTDCVVVCPCGWFREGDHMLFIAVQAHPREHADASTCRWPGAS
jgi:hypothetical protein